ncbi:MAG: oligosaccharide flippase family protein [Colwellia sp.]
MSVKRSLVFNYTAQIYSALITVLVLPFYITRMGAEGFGLMGFFLMLQAWAQILDAGVGGSLTRQTSITKNDGVIFKKFLKQFYIVTSVFLGVASIFFIIGYLGKGYIATTWLNSQLDQQVLEISLVAMFATLSFRYLSGTFRSGLVGLEKHATLSLNTIVFMSLRFPLGLYVLDIFDNSLTHYFIYQGIVSFLEFLVVAFLFIANSRMKYVNDNSSNLPTTEDYTLRALLVFSAQLSLLSITWVIVTQIDKLILSKFLELKDFGYYTLAVSVSGVIMVLSAPLSQILMPRLSSLASQRNEKQYLDVYIKSFLGLSIFVVPLAMFFVLFSEQLLFIWTGDKKVAEEAFPFIKWLALGNAISVLMNFIFILQYSMGKLRAHVLAYVGYSLLLIPMSIFIASHYKAPGAAFFWFLHNLIFFIVWGGVVHRKYLVGVSSYIWKRVLIPCLVITSLYLFFLKSVVIFLGNPLSDLIILVLIGVSNIALLLGYFWLLRKRNITYIDKLCFSTSF